MLTNERIARCSTRNARRIAAMANEQPGLWQARLMEMRRRVFRKKPIFGRPLPGDEVKESA